MMTKSHSIEVLGQEDVERLKALMSVFAVAFEDPDTYASEPPGAEYLSELLGSPNFITIVATAGSEVVGGLTAYVLPKPERRRSEMYIYDLAVALPYRRQGIATGLIEELKQVARQRGAWVIFVQADLGDDPAIELYTKLGVREDVLHFDIAP